MLNWLSLWQSMTWISKALTEACPGCILPLESFGEHHVAALVFFEHYSLLLLPVLCCDIAVQLAIMTFSLCSFCAAALKVHNPCLWGYPWSQLSSSSSDSAGPGGGVKHGYGEFGKAPSDQLDFEVWSQSPRGCGLQFASFLVEESPRGLVSAGPPERGEEPLGDCWWG